MANDWYGDEWNSAGWTAQKQSDVAGGTSPTTPALPPEVKTVTVTISFINDEGKPSGGRFIFEPSVDRLVDPTSGLVIRLRRRDIKLVNGTASIVLIATDNEALSPRPFTYKVSGVVDGQTQKSYDIALPYAAPNVVLASLVPTESSTGTINLPAVLTVNNDAGPHVILDAAKVGADPAGAAAAAQTAAASDATAKVTAHTTAVDPHGDRADAASKYLARLGGVLTGSLTLDGGNVTIARHDGTGAFRFRVTGGGLDQEIAGLDVIISHWSNADFTGTQAAVARWEAAGPHLIGLTQFGTNPYDAVHSIDAGTGIASLGAKNGLTNIRLAGFKGTAGKPTTGTWAAGDVVLDSAGAWHLCTAPGTPGTWT